MAEDEGSGGRWSGNPSGRADPLRSVIYSVSVISIDSPMRGNRVWVTRAVALGKARRTGSSCQGALAHYLTKRITLSIRTERES